MLKVAEAEELRFHHSDRRTFGGGGAAACVDLRPPNRPLSQAELAPKKNEDSRYHSKRGIPLKLKRSIFPATVYSMSDDFYSPVRPGSSFIPADPNSANVFLRV